MEHTRLHLYDFDGTLFRSPEPPPGWDQESWYGDPASLSAPCVPTFPPATWWITSTVQSAKRAISDPNVYTVMATGRQEHPFKNRLEELLQAAHLDFDEMHLRPHGRTADFKVRLVRQVLDDHPSITRVDLWEDQERNMAMYRVAIQGMGVSCKVHPVKFKPMPAWCRRPSPARVASMWVRR